MMDCIHIVGRVYVVDSMIDYDSLGVVQYGFVPLSEVKESPFTEMPLDDDSYRAFVANGRMMGLFRQTKVCRCEGKGGPFVEWEGDEYADADPDDPYYYCETCDERVAFLNPYATPVYEFLRFTRRGDKHPNMFQSEQIKKDGFVWNQAILQEYVRQPQIDQFWVLAFYQEGGGWTMFNIEGREYNEWGIPKYQGMVSNPNDRDELIENTPCDELLRYLFGTGTLWSQINRPEKISDKGYTMDAEIFYALSICEMFSVVDAQRRGMEMLNMKGCLNHAFYLPWRNALQSAIDSATEKREARKIKEGEDYKPPSYPVEYANDFYTNVYFEAYRNG